MGHLRKLLFLFLHLRRIKDAGTGSVVRWSVNLYNICCTGGECGEDLGLYTQQIPCRNYTVSFLLTTKWLHFWIKFLRGWTDGFTFYSQCIILLHNAKPRNPVTECVQQTMLMKYADRKKPLPQLLICHASVTLFPTWLGACRWTSPSRCKTRVLLVLVTHHLCTTILLHPSPCSR